MGTVNRETYAALSAAWGMELETSQRYKALSALLERRSARLAARLSIFSTFCRAHASRHRARLTSMLHGAPLLLALPTPPPCFSAELLYRHLVEEAAFAFEFSDWYDSLRRSTFAAADVSTSWLSSLHVREWREMGYELQAAAEELREQKGAA